MDYTIGTDNEMDPGEIPVHLRAVTQAEDMILARSLCRSCLSLFHRRRVPEREC
jgi:hypothetical protein